MTRTATTKSREEWLNKAATQIRKHIKSTTGVVVPAVRISVGFPYRGRSNTIGQCWAGAAVKDGKPAIFISPVLTDTARVLDVLAHEMVHAAFPMEGHKGEFSKTAKAIGLVAPWTATTASPEFAKTLKAIAKRIGRYGHSPIRAAGTVTIKGTPSPSPVPGGKVVGKQSTRMLKVSCPDDGYTVRTTAKWIAVGFPTCPCGTEMTIG